MAGGRGVIFFSKPQPDDIRRFLAQQRESPYSYSAIGATATQPPAGFRCDSDRVQIGAGLATFEAARQALQQWQQFSVGWAAMWPPETPIQPGDVLAILGSAVGVWWVNACRIVYVTRSDEPTRTFAFAYGTLPDHIATGEERFAIEWDPRDDSVWYEISAFSKPGCWQARLGYPLMRRLQRRFARDSARALARAVQQALHTGSVERQHAPQQVHPRQR